MGTALTPQPKAGELQSILERHLPQPYRFYRQLVPDRALRSLAIARVRRLIDRVGPAVVAFRKNEETLGAAGWCMLPSESEQFGFGAGRLEFLVAQGDYFESRKIKSWMLEEILASCRERGVRHLVARVEAGALDTIHSLEKAGFETIDGIQTFSMPLRSHLPAPAAGFEARLFSPSDLEQVLAIARSANVYDRFHADAALSKQTAEAVNETWVRNACAGRTADAVVVVCESGVVLGYATCKLDAEAADCLGVSLGSIGMVATAVQARRRGIGRAATLAALEWFRQHRVEAVDAGTQFKNLAAACLYERCGFQLADISLTFRKLMRT